MAKVPPHFNYHTNTSPNKSQLDMVQILGRLPYPPSQYFELGWTVYVRVKHKSIETPKAKDSVDIRGSNLSK